MKYLDRKLERAQEIFKYAAFRDLIYVFLDDLELKLPLDEQGIYSLTEFHHYNKYDVVQYLMARGFMVRILENNIVVKRK